MQRMTRLANFAAINLWLVTALAAEPQAAEKAGLDWWAFQAPQRTAVPAVEVLEADHPIDAFVRARLESAGM